MTMRVSSLARWGLALLLVLALHLGLLLWSLYWKPQAMPALLAPPAMRVPFVPLFVTWRCWCRQWPQTAVPPVGLWFDG